ncbi:RNA polymerase II-associated protein 3 [Stomoxys calcitrans]|uniref:RNA polymerase II-associated protein 3 n=1 Tax=Stomoxys calcitrans TaxID=35570 RepID=A0A1I8QBD9_STOCA|nr:RNA polymerase II-associated protein 3 [Stomoxys calcitrans]
MDAARKSFEMTSQVRQNAEELKNAMNDLYSWEKEIKDKEKKIQNAPATQYDGLPCNKNLNTLPVPRSHNQDLASKNSNEAPLNDLSGGKAPQVLDSPSEKRDNAPDPLELRHKEANEIKDRGNNFVKLGKYMEAIEQYTAAIEHYPEDAIYYTNRALCFLKLERYDECIEDCDRATELDNLAVKAYYRRMQANESLGNNMDALKDCTTVLMIEPKNSEANRSLERINDRLRKNAKSAKGPNFTSLRSNMLDILPIDKPAYKRSNKPLKRINIADVVGPKEIKNHDNLKISDEDIDKLFNSNCGYFQEVKNPEARLKAKEIAAKQKETKTVEDNNKDVAKEKLASIKQTATTSKDAVVKPAKEEEKNNSAKAKEDSNKLEASLKATTSEIEIAGKSPDIERPLPSPAKTAAQFYSNWKELTPQQKYQYLKGIQINQLCKILGAGFDSDTLTDIIRTLHDFYLPAKESSLASTLLEVSKNKQVPILSLLMSNEERKALSGIVNSLKESNTSANAAADAAQIMKNFNLN